MNGPIHQCEPPRNAVDALIHGDNPLAYAKRHEDLHGTNDTDGSAGCEEMGASATKLTPASMTHASRNCGSSDSATCDSRRPAVDKTSYRIGYARILPSWRLSDAPVLNHALAAEGERLVAALCAQHRRSRT